jgi:hypothetical protein
MLQDEQPQEPEPEDEKALLAEISVLLEAFYRDMAAEQEEALRKAGADPPGCAPT